MTGSKCKLHNQEEVTKFMPTDCNRGSQKSPRITNYFQEIVDRRYEQNYQDIGELGSGHSEKPKDLLHDSLSPSDCTEPLQKCGNALCRRHCRVSSTCSEKIASLYPLCSCLAELLPYRQHAPASCNYISKPRQALQEEVESNKQESSRLRYLSLAQKIPEPVSFSYVSSTNGETIHSGQQGKVTTLVGPEKRQLPCLDQSSNSSSIDGGINTHQSGNGLGGPNSRQPSSCPGSIFAPRKLLVGSIASDSLSHALASCLPPSSPPLPARSLVPELPRGCAQHDPNVPLRLTRLNLSYVPKVANSRVAFWVETHESLPESASTMALPPRVSILSKLCMAFLKDGKTRDKESLTGIGVPSMVVASLIQNFLTLSVNLNLDQGSVEALGELVVSMLSLRHIIQQEPEATSKWPSILDLYESLKSTQPIEQSQLLQRFNNVLDQHEQYQATEPSKSLSDAPPINLTLPTPTKKRRLSSHVSSTWHKSRKLEVWPSTYRNLAIDTKDSLEREISLSNEGTSWQGICYETLKDHLLGEAIVKKVSEQIKYLDRESIIHDIRGHMSQRYEQDAGKEARIRVNVEAGAKLFITEAWIDRMQMEHIPEGCPRRFVRTKDQTEIQGSEDPIQVDMLLMRTQGATTTHPYNIQDIDLAVSLTRETNDKAKIRQCIRHCTQRFEARPVDSYFFCLSIFSPCFRLLCFGPSGLILSEQVNWVIDPRRLVSLLVGLPQINEDMRFGIHPAFSWCSANEGPSVKYERMDGGEEIIDLKAKPTYRDFGSSPPGTTIWAAANEEKTLIITWPTPANANKEIEFLRRCHDEIQGLPTVLGRVPCVESSKLWPKLSFTKQYHVASSNERLTTPSLHEERGQQMFEEHFAHIIIIEGCVQNLSRIHSDKEIANTVIAVLSTFRTAFEKENCLHRNLHNPNLMLQFHEGKVQPLLGGWNQSIKSFGIGHNEPSGSTRFDRDSIYMPATKLHYGKQATPVSVIHSLFNSLLILFLGDEHPGRARDHPLHCWSTAETEQQARGAIAGSLTRLNLGELLEQFSENNRASMQEPMLAFYEVAILPFMERRETDNDFGQVCEAIQSAFRKVK